MAHVNQECSDGGAQRSDAPINTSEGSSVPLNVHKMTPKQHTFPDHFSMPECIKFQLHVHHFTLKFFCERTPRLPAF